MCWLGKEQEKNVKYGIRGSLISKSIFEENWDMFWQANVCGPIYFIFFSKEHQG